MCGVSLALVFLLSHGDQNATVGFCDFGCISPALCYSIVHNCATELFFFPLVRCVSGFS